MHNPPPNLADQPILWAIVFVGGTLYLVGMLWIRRIVGGDPEPDSFWATARRRSRLEVLLLPGLVLGLVVVALLMYQRV